MEEEAVNLLQESKTTLKFLKTVCTELYPMEKGEYVANLLSTINGDVDSLVKRIDILLNYHEIGINSGKTTIDDVIRCVCYYYKLSEEEVLKKSRYKQYVIARQMIMYICHKVIKPHYTTTDIGKRLNNLDHATVVHGSKQISNYIYTGDRRANELKEIIEIVNGIINVRK